MITRDELIFRAIKTWLVGEGKNMAWLARQIGVKYSTLVPVLRGKTQNNIGVKGKVSELIGFDPWKRFPEVPYQPPAQAEVS